MFKIKVNKIKRHWESEEPMPCERVGCDEKLNGLNHHIIYLSKEFMFDLWLCKKCSKEFQESFGVRKSQNGGTKR